MALIAAVANADGGYVEPTTHETTGGYVEMVEQRALLWRRADQVELWIQNRYHNTLENFGWVIPLPRLPSDVGCIEEPVLDALDHETAPIFQTVSWDDECYGYYDGCGAPIGCGLGGDDDGGDELGGAIAADGGDVQVWLDSADSCLSYQVVSSPDGAALMGWLGDHGYEFDDLLAAQLGDYASWGYVFLVAEIFAEDQTGGGQSNQTVRIAWPRLDDDELVYPMAITGRTASSTLDLRLYVAADQAVVPLNYGSAFVPPPDEPHKAHDQESYQLALDEARAQNGGRSLVIEYSGDLRHRFGTCGDEYDTDYYVSYRGWEAVLDDPDTCPQSPELWRDLSQPGWLSKVWEDSEPWQELVAEAPQITRLSGALAPEHMDEDIRVVPAVVRTVIPTFRRLEYCGEVRDESTWMAIVAGKLGSPFRLACAALLLGIAFVRRRMRLVSLGAVGVLFAVCCSPDSDTTAPDAGPQLLPAVETCDGLDNDLNGLVDELWPALGQQCSIGIGECAVVGEWICSADGTGTDCAGEAGSASAEACNGLDDDCNGSCDDGFDCCAGVHYACANACNHVGLSLCDGECSIAPCVASAPESFSRLPVPLTDEHYLVGSLPVEATGEPPSEVALLIYNSETYAEEVLLLGGGGLTTVLDELPMSTIGAGDFEGDGTDELVIQFWTGVDYDEALTIRAFTGSGVIERWRIGPTGTPPGDGELLYSPDSLCWVGMLGLGAPGERVMITFGASTDQIYAWPFTDGSFGEITPGVPWGGNYWDAVRTHIADLDADGIDDLVLPCGVDTCVATATQLLNPDPEQWTRLEQRAPAGLADLDHDGDVDLLLWVIDPPDLESTTMVEVVSYPELTVLGTLDLPWPTIAYSGIAAGDMDADGFDEIAIMYAEPAWETFSIHLATEPTVSELATPSDPLLEIETVEDSYSWGIQRGPFTIDWDGVPGLDLLQGTGLALSPAGCAIAED